MFDMAFLDYYKMILDRVSCYPEIFLKEYKKAERHLQGPEVGHLNQWLDARGLQVLLNECQTNKTETNQPA